MTPSHAPSLTPPSSARRYGRWPAAAAVGIGILVLASPSPASTQEGVGETAPDPPVTCRGGEAVDPGAPGVAWGDTAAAARYLADELGVNDLESAELDSLLRRGEAAFRAGLHTVAYVAFSRVAERTGGFEPLWKASRAAVDVGQDVEVEEDAGSWYGIAERYARRALDVNPAPPDGHLHLAHALGLVALEADVRERVRLSVEVREEALAAIEADSSYAGGWHVLGRWNEEVMELSSFGRFFARTFLGGEVMGEASWEKAAAYLKRASELEPDRIVHHLELGKILRKTDRPDEARRALKKVLELPPRDRHDCVYKAEAEELLEEMGP